MKTLHTLKKPNEVREDFPVLARKVDAGGITYLDSAATTLKPAPVIEAVTSYYAEVSANIHRGKHILSEEASERYEQVRSQIAAFLDVPPANVVFTANTTAGLNLVASGLPLRPGDLVALPVDSHHSAQLPWRHRFRTAWIEAGENQTDEADFQRVLRERPAVVVFTACSNVTGRCADLARLVPQARRKGAYTVVDAAQLVPHRGLRISSEMDAVAFSSHKMLGPTGVGVLYLSDRMIEAIGTPSSLGGGTVDWAGHEGFRLRRPPYRFEAGTPDIAGVYGLGAALSYLTGLGEHWLREHDQRLLRTALEEAARRDYLHVVGGESARDRVAILSLTVDGIGDLAEVARCLSDSYGVMCRTGFFCSQPYFERYGLGPALRLAPYIYNDEEDLRLAFGALDEVWHFLCRK